MDRGLKHWDRMSGRGVDLAERFDQSTFNRLIVGVLDLKPGDRVLDLGCGAGSHLRPILDAIGPDGHVLAFDYSPKMVARTRARVAAEGWHNVEVRQADATTVDLAGSEFDAVLASWSISATQDVPAAVNTAYTALRPGGRLFTPDMRLVPRGVSAPMIWLLGRIYRLVAGWTGVDVLETVQARFGNVGIVNGDGEPLDVERLSPAMPVAMIVATKPAEAI